MGDQQWWQGGDADWRPGPVPPGFWMATDGRWYPPGTGAASMPGPGTDDLDATALSSVLGPAVPPEPTPGTSTGTATVRRCPWCPARDGRRASATGRPAPG